jgi:hypothetical protein
MAATASCSTETDARFSVDLGGPADLPNAGAPITDNDQHLVTAFQEDGSGVAEFIFVTDNVGGGSDDCFFAGTATGSNN